MGNGKWTKTDLSEFRSNFETFFEVFRNFWRYHADEQPLIKWNVQNLKIECLPLGTFICSKNLKIECLPLGTFICSENLKICLPLCTFICIGHYYGRNILCSVTKNVSNIIKIWEKGGGGLGWTEAETGNCICGDFFSLRAVLVVPGVVR